MIIKLKWLVVIQAIIIAALLSAVINSYLSKTRIENKAKEGLLSPRVYSGLLDPKSFLLINFAPLKENVKNYITKNNINASVYVENLRNGAFMVIGEKTGFFPASLNKLPVAIIIMKKIEMGELSLDTRIEITDFDRTDTSGELYKTKEKEITVEAALEKLLKESDNTALRILLRQVDLEDLQLLLDYYGLDISVDLQNKQRLKQPDFITPKAISTLYLSLYFSTVLEPKNSEYLLLLLAESEVDINRIANLPENIKVAHKFGENYYGNNMFFHDCGIIYIDESRILYCIMTKDLSVEEATETIGTIVNQIYHYVKDTKARLEAYTHGQK